MIRSSNQSRPGVGGPRLVRLVGVLVLGLLLSLPASAQTLLRSIGFGPFQDGDRFGQSVAPIGDINQDGGFWFAVGVPGCDWGWDEMGCVAFLKFDPGTDTWDRFANAGIRDFDDTDGPHHTGTYMRTLGPATDDPGLYTFLSAFDGSRLLGHVSAIDNRREIDFQVGDYAPLGNPTSFGKDGAAGVGDLDDNGTIDFVLRSGDRLRTHFASAASFGSLTVTSEVTWDIVEFGTAFQTGTISSAGDLDGDGIRDIVIGGAGQLAVALMQHGGLPREVRLVPSSAVPAAVTEEVGFGDVLSPAGDVDGDGTEDLWVGLPEARDGAGSIVLFFLNADGSVRNHVRYDGGLETGDGFGSSIARLADLDDDGTTEVVVGSPGADVDGQDTGAVHLLSVTGQGVISPLRRIDNRSRALEGFNVRPVPTEIIPDFNEDGVDDYLAVANPGDFGDAAIHLANENGSIKARLPVKGSDIRADRAATHILGGATPVADMNGDGRVELFLLMPDQDEPYNNPYGFYAGKALVSLDAAGNVERMVGAPHDDFSSAFTALPDDPSDETTRIFYTGGGTNFQVHYVRIDSLLRETFHLGLTPLYGVGAISCGSSLVHLGNLVGVEDSRVVACVTRISGSNPQLSFFFLLPVQEGGRWRPISPGDPVSRLPDADLELLGSLDDVDRDGHPELVLRVGPSDAASPVWLYAPGPDGSPRWVSRLWGEEDSPLDGAVSIPYGKVWQVDDLDESGDGVPDLAINAGNRFWWVSIADRLPAVVDSIDAGPGAVLAGKDNPVRVRVVDTGGGIGDVRLHLRPAGSDGDFYSVGLQPDEDDWWRADVPGVLFTASGIEYFIKTRNAHGLELREPYGDGFFSVPGHTDRSLIHPVELGDASEAYRIYGLPIFPDSADVRALLEAGFGRYDPSRWRLFTSADGDDEYDASEPLELAPGQGFWLLAHDAGRVLRTGPGTSAPSGVPFEVRLKRGWNLVGNPFPFPVPEAGLSMKSGREVRAHRYDGSWSAVEGREWIGTFEGMVVYSEKIDTLEVHAPGIATNEDHTTPPAASKSAETGWRVQVHATKGRARDTDTVLGVRPEASDGFDPLDSLEPPRIGDYVGLALSHPDPSAPERLVSADLRASAPGQTWTLEVTSATPGRVDLRFEALAELPDGTRLVLVDPAKGTEQDLASLSTYAVASDGATSRELLIEVRGGDVPDETPPSTFALHAPFPNPFAGATTLAFDVPTDTRVRLEVFDILGRSVARLIDGPRAAGRHSVVWDAMHQASGLYLVRLTGSGRSITRSVLVRH